MKWVKASERMPESTRGYGKQIVTKWVFDKIDGRDNIQMRVTTANQLIDLCKTLIDKNKVEWLDETEPQ